MANKYVSHGNTFNGDGTLATAATVDGGAGAWNNLNEVWFDGVTYGSVDNGDIVYMRTAISGVDIEIDYTVDKSSQSYGAKNNPVFFVADDGTKWAGENGQIILTVSNNNYEIFTGDRGYVWWICGDKDNCRLRIVDTSVASHNQLWMNFVSAGGSIFEGIETDVTDVSTNTKISQIATTGALTFNNCNFRHFRRRYDTVGYGSLTLSTGMIRINGSYFDATDGVTATNGGIDWGSYGSGIMIRGCELKGFPSGDSLFCQMSAVDTTYSEKWLYASFCDFKLALLDYVEDELGHIGYGAEFINYNNSRNSRLESSPGYTEWLNGKNFPYNASVLPTDDVWTLKVTNGKEISEVHPFIIGGIKKLWNQTASKLKITLNFIIKDTSGTSHSFDDIKAKHFYAVSYYIDDTTGRTKCLFSPIDDTALVSSSAIWLPTVGGNIAYGENSYNAYKIELSTTTTVKEDSLVGMAIVTGIPKLDNSDYNFIDPDITLEAIS